MESNGETKDPVCVCVACFCCSVQIKVLHAVCAAVAADAFACVGEGARSAPLFFFGPANKPARGSVGDGNGGVCW